MRMRNTTRPPLRSTGFTLLELLIAVAIFSICTIALVNTFRVATRAFQTGRRAAGEMQTLRFTVEQVSRDLRAVFYESDYNQRFEEMAEQMSQNEAALLQRVQEAREKAGEDGSDPAYIGLKVDLQFVGDSESLQFAHFVPSDGTYDNATWGAERVHYFLAGPEKTDLYRQTLPVLREVSINPNIEEEIANASGHREVTTGSRRERRRRSSAINIGDEETPDVDVAALAHRGTLPEQYQVTSDVTYLVESVPKPTPPELIAERVVEFDLKYGVFSGTWSETTSWDSESKQNRSPEFNVSPHDPEFQMKLREYQIRPDDHLPAYIRMTLTVREETRNRRRTPKTRTMETLVWLPASLEVFTPDDEEAYDSEASER